MTTCSNEDARFIKNGKHFLACFRTSIFPPICATEWTRRRVSFNSWIIFRIGAFFWHCLYDTLRKLSRNLINTHRSCLDFAIELVYGLGINPKIRTSLTRIGSRTRPIYCGVPSLQAVVAINWYKFKFGLVLEFVEACRAWVQKAPM